MASEIQINVGIAAFDVFEGGEFAFVKGLVDALKSDPAFHIQIFSSEKHFYAGDAHHHELRALYSKEKNISIHEVKFSSVRFSDGKPIPRKFLLNALPSVSVRDIALPSNVDVLIVPYIHDQVLRFVPKGLPYIITPHDLRYLDDNHDENFVAKIKEKIRHEIRKKMYQEAAGIVVDSEYVKNQLIRYYKVRPETINIIGYEGAVYRLQNLNISIIDSEKLFAKFSLPEKFVFYPAHLIQAKNHINLINSILHVREKYGVDIPLVLSGSYKEEGQNVLDLINEKASELVKYIGFISEEELFGLYHSATALVYASKYDPTGIPIWEAFFCGTPVAASRIFAIPEQVRDAGLLFDPDNIEEMADQIYKIWKDENLQKDLAAKGRERIKDMSFANYSRKWRDTVRNAVKKK